MFFFLCNVQLKYWLVTHLFLAQIILIEQYKFLRILLKTMCQHFLHFCIDEHNQYVLQVINPYFDWGYLAK